MRHSSRHAFDRAEVGAVNSRVESSRDPVGGHKSVGWQSDTEAVDSALSRTFELVNITVVKIGDCQHIFYSDKISGN